MQSQLHLLLFLGKQTPSQSVRVRVLETVTSFCRGENALALEDDKLAAKLNEEGWKAPDADDSVPADGDGDADVKPEKYLPAIDPGAEVSHAAHAPLTRSIPISC